MGHPDRWRSVRSAACRKHCTDGFSVTAINPITQFFANASSGLTRWFDGLFTPADPKLALFINNGFAALAWPVKPR